jgi:uncharacterized protein
MSIDCPICRKAVPVEKENRPQWYPFCSERCRQVDLLRWSNGKYAIVEQLSPEAVAQRLEEEGDSAAVD